MVAKKLFAQQHSSEEKRGIEEWSPKSCSLNNIPSEKKEELRNGRQKVVRSQHSSEEKRGIEEWSPKSCSLNNYNNFLSKWSTLAFFFFRLPFHGSRDLLLPLLRRSLERLLRCSRSRSLGDASMHAPTHEVACRNCPHHARPRRLPSPRINHGMHGSVLGHSPRSHVRACLGIHHARFFPHSS